ncbi:putative dual-specificity RNA methyltransferase RlmN [bioreactor metagenome]|uniref:Putative dual-specificity RNA methyltransferase RlmN n=1 Tax=bioreactor metagenome TaxID=1076179 RepID=A0A645FC37_9ZZZZ
MPINKKYNIERHMKSCREYTEKTKRRISFEYALIDRENNSKQHAYELSHLLKGMLCHVNLIPVNPAGHTDYKPTDEKDAYRFAEILSENGLNATVRRRLGRDIDAACGQLKGKFTSKE